MILRVTVADKLHNARAIYRDLQDLGPALWERFNKPAEQTVAYYSALFRKRRADPTLSALMAHG